MPNKRGGPNKQVGDYFFRLLNEKQWGGWRYFFCLLHEKQRVGWTNFLKLNKRVYPFIRHLRVSKAIHTSMYRKGRNITFLA